MRNKFIPWMLLGILCFAAAIEVSLGYDDEGRRRRPREEEVEEEGRRGPREEEVEEEGRRGPREEEVEGGRRGREEWEEEEGGRRGREEWEEEEEGRRGRGQSEQEEGGRRGREEEEGGRRGRQEREAAWEGKRFLLQEAKSVVRTDAGQMRVVRGFDRGSTFVEKPMHIGFITMEPRSLYVPQYLDTSLIIFVRRGEATVGSIYKNDLNERRLRTGDIFRIPAGSAFYIVNTGEGQRLHIICSIDTSESLGMGPFQSFFIGGGTNPTSILSGFDKKTLAAAFNVTTDELSEIMSSQGQGPIVYLGDSRAPSVWANFLKLKQEDNRNHMKRLVEFDEEDEEDDKIQDKDVQDQKSTWSWRKLLTSVFFCEEKDSNKDDKRTTRSSPDSYNLYDRKPDFRNAYGWSIALDEHDYKPLKHSGIGIYLVNLTAGSMMAPHVNPTATEFGIVLRGSGSLQIVAPNGTLALNTEITEGDVFWVPKYFPFCQIASRTGPLEFFGFTTSSRRNRPQFLVGASSILQTLRGPEIAAAFGVTRERFDAIINAQREAVILPTAEVAPPDFLSKKMPEVIKKFD